MKRVLFTVTRLMQQWVILSIQKFIYSSIATCNGITISISESQFFYNIMFPLYLPKFISNVTRFAKILLGPKLAPDWQGVWTQINLTTR